MINGKCLWWDERDGHGIIVDEESNEYYTDISVIENREHLKRNDAVTFNKKILGYGMWCAVSVKRKESK